MAGLCEGGNEPSGSLKAICKPDLWKGDLTELGDDDQVAGEEGKQVVVGVCAMAKKSQSKPMREILMRLQEFEYLKMVVFPEEVILKVSFI
ncbi:hypothetical protein ANN_05654 [Periplaneta americana]|uniref:VIP1 N-terminal domain-containing protein n=1 Tax=Periplaneta americana TaxID=6978 RepID=A0ABQ8TDI4_PERAM|nr:hypothetical protein ANN_05654 [Periplaneta americana]